jgi:hypothetical protein
MALGSWRSLFHVVGLEGFELHLVLNKGRVFFVLKLVVDDLVVFNQKLRAIATSLSLVLISEVLEPEPHPLLQVFEVIFIAAANGLLLKDGYCFFLCIGVNLLEFSFLVRNSLEASGTYVLFELLKGHIEALLAFSLANVGPSRFNVWHSSAIDRFSVVLS